MKLQVRSKLFATTLCFLFTLAVPMLAVADDDTIKIGVAGAHSGSLASYGIPTANAAKIVAEKVNAAGGINGKQIELLVQDDVCKPEVAINVAKKLISDGVHVVLGHICSGPTLATLPLYTERDILTISPSATTPSLTKGGEFPVFYRTIAPDDAQAQVDVDFIINVLKAEKIALVHDKGDYGKSFVTFAREYLEASGKAEVVLEEGITPGAVDYSAVINKVRRSDADVVLYGGYHPEASKLVTTMRKKRMDTIFVSDDGVMTQTFIDVAGKNAEGVYASSSRDTSENPLTQQAIKEHEEKFGAKPGEFYLNGYAAMLALVNAIEKAGSTELTALKKILTTESVETPLGPISFDEAGDAKGIGYAVFKVIDGKFVEQN